MENKVENQIQIFEHEQFGKIRVVVIGGKIYFVAADVCRALELGNVSQALNRVPDKDKRFATIPVRGIISIDTQGGEQKMLVVNEPGFYRLAFSSRKKKAFALFELLRERYFSNNTSASASHSQSQEEGGSAENPIQIFEHKQFGKIRVVVIDGVPYFVGIDVAIALGYTNPQKALRGHVPDKYKRTERIVHPQGGTQNTTLINEAGMYRLILRSKLPAAEEFTDWVCEVIVTIRKTGSYSVATAPAQLKSSKRSEGQKSPPRVYVFRLAGGTVFIVKIGQSKNVEERKKEIERKYKVTIERTYYSTFFSRKVARLIERACHQIFSAHSLGKELFDIEFEEACKVINVFVDVIACIPQVSNFERAEKLLAVANMMTDSSEKQQLLISAGKFFADEKFT